MIILNLSNKKNKILTKLSSIVTAITLLAIQSNCLATSIGTAEVETATESVKRVITAIAMPLRWCFNFC